MHRDYATYSWCCWLLLHSDVCVRGLWVYPYPLPTGKPDLTCYLRVGSGRVGLTRVRSGTIFCVLCLQALFDAVNWTESEQTKLRVRLWVHWHMRCEVQATNVQCGLISVSHGVAVHTMFRHLVNWQTAWSIQSVSCQLLRQTIALR